MRNLTARSICRLKAARACHHFVSKPSHTWLKLIRLVPASSGCPQFLFVVFWASPHQQPAACWTFPEMLALIRHSSKTIMSVTVTETWLCFTISLSQVPPCVRLPLPAELLAWAGCADPSCGQRTSLGKQVPRSLWSPSERLQYGRLQVYSPPRGNCSCLAPQQGPAELSWVAGLPIP